MSSNSNNPNSSKKDPMDDPDLAEQISDEEMERELGNIENK